MPSPPSVHTSSVIRLPDLQAASPAKKQQHAADLPAGPGHVSSFAQRGPWTFPAAEELPAATIACLKVLDQILVEASPAAAAASDLGENQNGEKRETQSAGGDRTFSDKTQKAGGSAEEKAELELRGSSSRPKRRRDTGVSHEELTVSAADDSVEESGSADIEDQATKGSRKGLETRQRRIVKSYGSIFKLLYTAGVLNTLPKCLHMLHAICIVADQQRQIDPPLAAFDVAARPGTVCSFPKRRKLPVDGSVDVEAAGYAVQARERDVGRSGTCDANTDSRELERQTETESLLSAAPVSPEHMISKHAGTSESVLCNSDSRGSSSSEAHVVSLPTDCDSLAVCGSGWEHTQEFSVDRQQTARSPVHRHARTAHIAGLLLGYIEALGNPPPLSDPRFHEKVSHVLCRLFYTRHPSEGEHSTLWDSSTRTPAVRDSGGSSDAAVSGGDPSVKKSAGGSGEVSKSSVDPDGEGRSSRHPSSYEATPLTPLSTHEWRQQIIARFDTVERLLLCSVPTLFLGETAPETAQETVRTVNVSAGTAAESVDNVAGGGEASRKLPPDSQDTGSSAGGTAAIRGTAERQRDVERSGMEERDGRTESAFKCVSSAATLVQGRERCRRALRIVRRWVAFLLELEQERQTLIKRVLQASEEVQGLPHMLLQDTRESEQQVQHLSLGQAGNGCSSTTTTKRRSLLILKVEKEDGATQEPQKHGLDKEAASTGGTAGLHAEEMMEIRIQATQQVLLLPSLPPFTRPDVEAVHAARARFERCLLRWREAQDRRRQEEEEARKKAAAAAAAVMYVTERMQEQQQAQTAAYSAPPGTAAAATALLRQRSISHAFYILGLNPQTATLQMVEQVRKKWRVLLHPDKFVSVHSHLLQQATEAFKAFHVAVTEANRLLSQRRVEPSWSPPPPPPELTSGSQSSATVAAHSLGAAAVKQPARPDPQQAPVKGTAAGATCGENSCAETHKSCCPLPTHQFFPDVTVQVSRSKKKACTGGLVLHVHAPPSREGESPFAVIKEIRVFVLRPTPSDRPVWKLLPSTADVCLMIKKSVELKGVPSTATGESNASPVDADKHSSCPTSKVEIDALQPVELGVAKVYWVGVQVEGLHKSQSLVTWKPVTVCLSLPQDTESNTPPQLNDNGSGSSPVDGDAAADEASAGCISLPAASRALLAFLQTFTETSFVNEDCSFSGRLRDAIASLKRVLRQKKRSKKGEHARTCRQDIDEWKWVEDEAKQVLRECMERARTWESEREKETPPSATV